MPQYGIVGAAVPGRREDSVDVEGRVPSAGAGPIAGGVSGGVAGGTAGAMPAQRPLLGAGLLFIAAVVWGFAFVPQKLTVDALPAFSATSLRFVIAAPIALAIAGRRLAKPGISYRTAFVLGVMQYVIFVLQTAALAYAPVARVSLITGMYAVFVPLFAPLMGHARPTLSHWAGAALAFTGLLGLTGVVGGNEALTSVPLNIGDVLVLLHAIVSAFQILLIGKLAARADARAVNALQVTTVAFLSVPCALLVDGLPHLGALTVGAWGCFAYVAVLSTVLAFTLQLAGQKHASPPAAAVIMLLETPMGVVGALVFLDERMSLLQWLGAVVLLGGVIVSLAAELKRSRAA